MLLGCNSNGDTGVREGSMGQEEGCKRDDVYCRRGQGKQR